MKEEEGFHHENAGREKALPSLTELSWPGSIVTFCLPTEGPGSPVSQRDLGNQRFPRSDVPWAFICRWNSRLPSLPAEMREASVSGPLEGRERGRRSIDSSCQAGETRAPRWSPGGRAGSHAPHTSLLQRGGRGAAESPVPPYKPRGSRTQRESHRKSVIKNKLGKRLPSIWPAEQKIALLLEQEQV